MIDDFNDDYDDEEKQEVNLSPKTDDITQIPYHLTFLGAN